MEKKSIVEEALLSMKNLEEAVSENAKGILASTMKEEIKDLVKESLTEAEDDEEEVDDVEMSGDELDLDMDTDNDSEEMFSMDSEEDEDDDELDFDDDEVEPIDLTGASDEEILKVFKAMGDEDGIIVKKDNNKLHMTDENADVEYLIDLGESNEPKETMEMEMEDIPMGEEEEEELDFGMDNSMSSDDDKVLDKAYRKFFEEEMPEEEMPEEELPESEMEEIVYEIALDQDEEVDSDFVESMEEDSEYVPGMDSAEVDASEEYDYNESYKMETTEGKLSMKKPKGVGMGRPKFSYKNSKGGFDTNMKHVSPTKGTGKPKFEYKEGKHKYKKIETKEAARTLGMGSEFRQGGLPKPRAHSKFNANIKEGSVKQYEEQLRILREKNEEYRKALNIFREKLNEVAVFNSNLAYATRLFTEHSTTKQEKINILRRFDGAETLKESKNLYRTIKEELGDKPAKVVTESITNKIDQEVSSGSAQNLIESKTYENPQFMRMKDLMSKLIK